MMVMWQVGNQDPVAIVADTTQFDEQVAAAQLEVESFPLTDEERERQAESETEPTGCYRALAWIRGKGAR